MIRAALRAMVGRRGSFWGGSGTVLVVTLIVVVVVWIVHIHDRAGHPSIGGQTMLDATSSVLVIIGVVVSILIGALAGSYDVAQGTMRYLLMTGASRFGIYGTRIVATVLTVWLALAPAVLLAVLATFLLPHTAADGVSGSAVAAFLWAVALGSAVFALISMAVGSLLRSNGAAIAVALIINVALTPLLALLGAWNQTVADLTLPLAFIRLTGGDTSASIPVAAVALALWMMAFLTIGFTRVYRDEY